MSEHDPTLVRTAVHEASHATMAHYLGVPNGLISIKPMKGLLGVCHHGDVGMPELLPGDLGVPITLIRPDVRTAIEKAILIAVAGKLGAQILAPRTTAGRFEDADEIDDGARALELAGLFSLTQQEVASVAKDENDELEPDYEVAHWLANEMVGGKGFAGRLLSLLEAEAIEIIITPVFRGRVDALVPHLLEHRELSERAVVPILNAVADIKGAFI